MQQRNKPIENVRMEKLASKTDIGPSERPALSAKEQESLNCSLLYSAEIGKNTEVRRLIKAGADIAAKDKYDWTPLHFAAHGGYTKTCALLIGKYAESGGNIKKLVAAKDCHDRTPLYWASRGGYTQICALLLEKGASIDAMNNVGETAFMCAESAGKAETAEFLRLYLTRKIMGTEGAGRVISSFSECVSS